LLSYRIPPLPRERVYEEEPNMKKPVPEESASALIDELIADLADWRGETLAAIRKCILAADPEIVEEWKWMGSPVWSRDGMIAVANAHKDKVKVTFSSGAGLADADHLFNAGLDGNRWRAIDFFAGDKVNERALVNLVRTAIAFNQSNLKSKAASRPLPKPQQRKKR
jgi:hypothetical protein